jgi:Domain of unknown function (DUF4185)
MIRWHGHHFLEALFVSILLTVQLRAADWSAHAMPGYDRLFQRTNGWIGADGDFTVSLSNGLTLWLFSDTFVGEVRDGHRIHHTMIHNSAAWQHGVAAANVRVKYFYKQSPDGRPETLITPADGKGWFWIFAAGMARGKLYLFLPQIVSKPGKPAFGFRQIDTWLGEVSNPLAPPPQWHITQRKIPFAQFGTGEDVSFGSAWLKTNGFIYVYGCRERNRTGKKMILARVPETEPANFDAWRFRTCAGWSTNEDDMADLCVGVASEYSVSWLPALRQYVLICTENGLSDRIIARTAPEPWGPWSKAAVVYRCPDMKWNRDVFCYAAKAHPMLATNPDELIVTYAANSFELKLLMSDAQLYWPRFVRVTASAASPH